MTAAKPPYPEWIYRQSAVVPFRRRGGDLEVLLITTRRSGRWTLPKGIVEPGMTPAASALKEAGEEAGIRGVVGRRGLGSFRREKWGGLCRVEVFPLEVTEVAEDWPEASLRERVWLPPEKAAERLRPKALRRLVEGLPAALEAAEQDGSPGAESVPEPAARVIFLLRHAKSSWAEPLPADHERPLAGRGRRACEVMGDYIRLGDIAPQLVLCSTAVRARETLARIRPYLGEGVRVDFEEDLYETEADGHLALLLRLPTELRSVMLVGHNPSLEDLADLLVGAGDEHARARMAAKFPTAALAILEYPGGEWAELAPGACKLHSFVVPRDLEAAAPR